MSKKKVTKANQQIKLSFNGIPEGEFDIDHLMASLRMEYRALTVSAGALVVEAIMQAECEQLAGKPYARKTEIDRWGTESGYVVMGGQKVQVTRQRLRDKQKKEVHLASYERFQDEDRRTQAVFSRLVAGVSNRQYAKTVEEFGKGYGISKSVISRKTVEATAEQLRTLCERDLSTLDICVLVIDGVHVAETVHIVALGVETSGKKHVLGVRQGATENSQVCTELFEEMEQRGLHAERAVLVVIDGSKALRSAVDRFFGKRAVLQRCQFHKCSNVLQHLPDRYHAEYARKIHSAYSMTSYDDAKRVLEMTIEQLQRINESAARSLEEGLEETLTVHRLQLPGILRKSFSTSNLIESAFSQGSTLMRNVRRWSNNNQIQRWVATSLLQAEKNFRRVKGFRSMSVLVTALEQYTTQKGVDSMQKAA
jgi:transposase-like protein